MISVVVPAYNEEEGIPILYERLSRAAAGWGEDYELVIVDDGSRDGRLALLRTLASGDPRLKILSFSRNFGRPPRSSRRIGRLHPEMPGGV